MSTNELFAIFNEFHEKSPMVITDSNGTQTWMNVAFRSMFPAVLTSANNNIYANFAVSLDEESKREYSGITSQIFTCSTLFSSKYGTYSGIAISDGYDTLYSFNSGILDDSDIIERISVVNMEMASLSRELAKKNNEIQEANQRANNLLRTDFLTGCGNRRYFSERLEEFCARYNRDNSRMFCVVFADLNKFKYINDTFGHDTGDKALTLFADSIRRFIRKEDVFARIGGDEFAMIIECNDDKDCERFVEKLRTLTSTIKLPESDHALSSGYGFARPEGAANAEKLMKTADERLYADKNRIIS